MKLITSITSQPKQNHILKLDNNETATFRLYYYASQCSWYFDIEYKDYISNGNKVVLTINALRHLRNKLPFGLSFVSASNAESFQLEAFSNGETMMLLLNEEDVKTIEEEIYNA